MMKKSTRENTPRIREIEDQIAKLADELSQLVQPTKGELMVLRADLEVNPEIYSSYLIDENLDGDRYWISYNVLDMREENNESEEA